MIYLVLFLILIGIALAEQDSDLDGIPDREDRLPFDKDNDGMTDLWEKNNDLDPEKNDAEEDPDNDGITNLEEYRKGTNPRDNIEKIEQLEQPAPEKSNKIFFGAIGLATGLVGLLVYDIGSKKKKQKTLQRPNYPQGQTPQRPPTQQRPINPSQRTPIRPTTPPQTQNYPQQPQQRQTYYSPLTNQQPFRKIR